MMMRYYFPDDKDAKSSETGKSEDPPTDITKQNKPGDTNDKEKETVEVPEKALKHYKESGTDTEE